MWPNLRIIFVIALAPLIVLPSWHASADDRVGTLLVHVSDLQSDEGNLRFVLFDSEENFLERPLRAEIVEIETRQATWRVDDLPYGEYAVLVHHDIDSSGVQVTRIHGQPIFTDRLKHRIAFLAGSTHEVVAGQVNAHMIYVKEVEHFESDSTGCPRYAVYTGLDFVE